MDATEVAINSQVRAIAQKLLSKDPILFNSTLNAYFASHATYHGHALRIHGVSQIKHAAWLWNIGDWGTGASPLADKDVQWDEATKTAKIRALRHLRPFFLPLFTFAISVTTVLRFEEDKAADPKETLLYAKHWDDQWPIQQTLEHLPIVGLIMANLVTPVASFFAVLLANFLFAVNARIGSIERQWVEPGAERAERFVPKMVKSGFQRGLDVGEGWGESVLTLSKRIAYRPLKGVEFGARTAFSIANAILPIHLPTVSVFDDAAPKGSRSAVRRIPSPGRQQAARGARTSSSLSDAEDSDADSSATDLTLPAVVPKGKSGKSGKKHNKETAIKPATVEVGPTVNDANGHGRQGTHTVPAHQFNDAAANPHHGTEAKREHHAAAKSKSKKSKSEAGDDNSDHERSLLDKVHEDPKALRKAEKAAAAAEGDGHGHSSSGKSSKKKHGKEHAHPPSFKESLAK